MEEDQSLDVTPEAAFTSARKGCLRLDIVFRVFCISRVLFPFPNHKNYKM